MQPLPDLRSLLLSVLLAGSLGGVAACSVDDALTGADTVHGTGGHQPAPVDPWQVLDRIQQQGPPRYTSRVHACAKMRYQTIGNVLASRGVDLAATDEVSAGQIYRTSAAGLGAANYSARLRETIELGVATTAKLFDLYVQAAPEMIANLGASTACPGVALFTPAGRCDPDGVTCLLGVPATRTHLDICDHIVSHAADLDTGERLAVAVLASAAQTCE